MATRREGKIDEPHLRSTPEGRVGTKARSGKIATCARRVEHWIVSPVHTGVCRLSMPRVVLRRIADSLTESAMHRRRSARWSEPQCYSSGYRGTSSATAFRRLLDRGPCGRTVPQPAVTHLRGARHPADQDPSLSPAVCRRKARASSRPTLRISLARHKNSKVLLIDGDMRRYTVHEMLGTVSNPGLADYLAGKATAEEIMQRAENPSDSQCTKSCRSRQPHLYPRRQRRRQGGRPLRQREFGELIKAVSPYFDWIIVDSSPVLPVSDAVNLARSCDGVLSGRSKRRHEVPRRPARSQRTAEPPTFSDLCSMQCTKRPRLAAITDITPARSNRELRTG